MQILGQLQYWIVFGLSLLALGVEVFALAHAVRQRKDAFTATGKQTKTFWVAVLVLATLLGFVSLGGGLGLLAIIGIVGAGVYLADVRPAIDTIMGRRR